MSDWEPDEQWEDRAMALTHLIACGAHCKYYKVAALFFNRGKRLLSIGYNGPLPQEPHCDVVGCSKEDENGNKLPPGVGARCVGLHAEINAILNLIGTAIELKGSWLFCTRKPCWDCAKVLARIGIAGCTFFEDYTEDGQLTNELFQKKGIALRQYQRVEDLLSLLKKAEDLVKSFSEMTIKA